jgi:hypothetical protein
MPAAAFLLLIPIILGGCDLFRKDRQKDAPGPETAPLPSPAQQPVEKNKSHIPPPPVSSSSEASTYISLVSEGNRTVRTELTGNSALGRVIHIRDVHGMVNDEDPEKTDLGILVASARYQAEVLRLLEQRRPRHIFMEGYSRDVSHQDLVKEFNKFSDFSRMAPVISGMVPDPSTIGKEGVLDIAYWTTALFMLGGVRVYAYRHNDVTLRRVATDRENDEAYDWLLKKYSKYVKTHGENHDAIVAGTTFRKMNEKRETWLEREIQKVMQDSQWQSKNPDREVWVSFGAGHCLCDDFQKAKFNPQILSVYWSISHPELKKMFDTDSPKPCTP